MPAQPLCRNLEPLAAQRSYGALRRGAWLPSLTAPAENPLARAVGAEGVAGSWCCAMGRSVHRVDPQGKVLTWELAAASWALQTELQMGDLTCWSLHFAAGPPQDRDRGEVLPSSHPWHPANSPKGK